MTKQGKATANAKRFKVAMEKNGIVYGEAHGPHGGGTFRLKGGEKYSLNTSECNWVANNGGFRWEHHGRTGP